MYQNRLPHTATKPSKVRTRSNHSILKSAFKMVLDSQANLIVFATKGDYQEFLDSRDIELCRF